MNLRVLSELEHKVGLAVKHLADLKDERDNLKRENDSLRHQLDVCLKELEQFRNQIEKDGSVGRTARMGAQRGFNGNEIKARLAKLAGRLAALEDSWS